MSKLFIVANLKSNKNEDEAKTWLETFKKITLNQEIISDKEVIISPSFTHLNLFRDFILQNNLPVKLAAQNSSPFVEGPYTGEVNAKQIKDYADYVLVGHSERRQYFNETNLFCNEKNLFIQKHGMIPLYCVGETLMEREKNQTMEVIKQQLLEGLKNTSPDNLVVAYEPVWAIGTGKVATPEQAEEVHLFIKEELASIFGQNAIKVLYGGSVKPDNINSLMTKKSIDGALVGGASLKAESFLSLI